MLTDKGRHNVTDIKVSSVERFYLFIFFIFNWTSSQPNVSAGFQFFQLEISTLSFLSQQLKRELGRCEL